MNIWVPSICATVFIANGMLFCSPAPVSAADSTFKPFVAVTEEVTDNIFEVASNKRTEYITRIRPGVTFSYVSPLWTWDTAYTFEFRNYARNSKANEYNHDACLRGNIALVQNFLFLDLSDTYHRVTLDVSRNAATESSLFLNQTDQNIATISPYLLWRLKGDNTLKTGYRFTDTRYWGGGIDRREQSAFIDLSHAVSSKLSLSANYTFTHLESQPTQYNKHDLSGGFKYEYADKSFLYGTIGNSWQQFSAGGNARYLFWNAGVTHDFNFVVATIETSVQTSIDPLAVSTKETRYSGRLEKTLQRGMVGLSTIYSEFDDTQTDGGKRRTLAFNANGRYEVMQDLTANLSLTGERFSRQSSLIDDYPYRFTGVAGLSYLFKDELSLTLTYTYVINLLDLDTTSCSKQINKAVLEVKKSF